MKKNTIVCGDYVLEPIGYLDCWSMSYSEEVTRDYKIPLDDEVVKFQIVQNGNKYSLVLPEQAVNCLEFDR